MHSCLGRSAGLASGLHKGPAFHGQQQQRLTHMPLAQQSYPHSSCSCQHRQLFCQAAAAEQAPTDQQHPSIPQQQQQQQQQQQPQPHQQSHQQSHQQQQRRYNGPPAALVGNTWGVAERRAQLASLVKAADSVDGLAAVWLRCRAAAGPAELTVLFNRLAAVCEPRKMSVKGWNNAKALLRDLLIASEDKMQLMGGPEFVYIIAALAKLRAAPDQAWLNRWLAVSRHKLNLLGPSQLVMCTRALCRLDMQPGDVKACIAFPAWMHNYLAAVRSKMASCSAFDLTKLVRSLADLGYKPARPFLNEFASAVEPKLSALDSINLAALMGAFSALKYEPEATFMKAFYAEVYQKLPLFDDQDLATALCAFSSMRKLMKGDFLAEFLSEVAEKLPTFGTPELASVLTALGQLQYKPGDEWTGKVAEHLQSRLMKANIHTISAATWGLAACGHKPSQSFMEDLLTASINKLGALDSTDAVMLLQAISKFGLRPKIGSRVHRTWLKWFERYCLALDKRALHPKQVMSILEAFATCQVLPEPNTVDHLVLQLVQGGLQHAPVRSIAQLLQLLVASDHSPGPLFIQNYAHCLQLVAGSLSAEQIAKALKCLADQRSFQPRSWWLVKLLAITHSRFTEFDALAAADTLYAAAKLTRKTALPSEKWAADISNQFWDHVREVAEVEQLGQGLWGSLMVGFSPTEDQWRSWEAAAAKSKWSLPLAAARDAVQGYRKVQRPVPSELLEQLQREYEVHKARQAVEVAAAEQARREAAAQLALQQQRMAAATAAIAQQQGAQVLLLGQQQQQQHPHGNSSSSRKGAGGTSFRPKSRNSPVHFSKKRPDTDATKTVVSKPEGPCSKTNSSSSSRSSSSNSTGMAALVAVPA